MAAQASALSRRKPAQHGQRTRRERSGWLWHKEIASSLWIWWFRRWAWDVRHALAAWSYPTLAHNLMNSSVLFSEASQLDPFGKWFQFAELGGSPSSWAYKHKLWARRDVRLPSPPRYVSLSLGIAERCLGAMALDTQLLEDVKLACRSSQQTAANGSAFCKPLKRQKPQSSAICSSLCLFRRIGLYDFWNTAGEVQFPGICPALLPRLWPVSRGAAFPDSVVTPPAAGKALSSCAHTMS